MYFGWVDLWSLSDFERPNFLSLDSLAIIHLMDNVDLSLMAVKLSLLRRFRLNKTLTIGPSYRCIDVTVRNCFIWSSSFSSVTLLDGFSMRINLKTLIIVLWLAKWSKLLISCTCKVLEIGWVFSADICGTVHFLLSGVILMLTWNNFLCLLLRFYIQISDIFFQGTFSGLTYLFDDVRLNFSWGCVTKITCLIVLTTLRTKFCILVNL